VGDDAWIAELLGGALDAEVGEGGTGLAFLVHDAAPTVFRLHGDREFMEEIDADAQHLRHVFDRVDVIRGGHVQAARAVAS
jgi:hypothetical protein